MPTWLGNAVNVPDVCTITLTGAWAADDTATFTINNNDLVVTAGAGVTTSDLMATLIATCWESSVRVSTSLGSCNAGGKSIGEFAEILCTVSGSVLTFTTRQNDDAGKPFKAYLTRSEVTAGSGALGAVTSVQAATGKNWWNNADNWSGNAVPADGDTVTLQNSSVSILWGFPILANNKRFDVLQYQSFTGQVGLLAVNVDNKQSGLPLYSEYRPLGPVLSDGAGPGNCEWTFGLGQGAGSTFQRWTFIGTSTGTMDARVYQTSAQQFGGSVGTPDMILSGVETASVEVLKGNVGLTGSFTSVKSGFQGAQNSDVTLSHDGGDACDYVITGGTVVIRNHTGNNNLDQWGGAVTLQETEMGIGTLHIHGGTMNYNSGSDIHALIVDDGAVADFSVDVRPKTVTDATLRGGSTLKDPFNILTHTNPVSTPEGIENVKWIGGPATHYAKT